MPNTMKKLNTGQLWAFSGMLIVIAAPELPKAQFLAIFRLTAKSYSVRIEFSLEHLAAQTH